MPQAHVYQLNEMEWWAGYDLESVQQAYMAETGLPADEAFDEPYELSEEQLEKMKLFDSDAPKGADTPTFKQALQGLIDSKAEFPRFFASMEY